MMQQALLSLVVLLASSVCGAEDAQEDPKSDVVEPRANEEAAAQLLAEVVALDAKARTITVKAPAGDPASAEMTLAVEEETIPSLEKVEPGEQVTLTCRQGTAQSACVVIAIERVERRE